MNLVEELAHDWFENGPLRENCEVSATDEARWWLNAIADAAEKLQYTEGQQFARWLRFQANPDSAESD